MEVERTMCVGMTARVLKVNRDVALVDASGARRQISAALLPSVEPGDYVMVHAGAAIAKVGEGDAEESAGVLRGLFD